MERMTLAFLDEGKSFIAVCNDNMDDRIYWNSWIEAFAAQCSLPLMAFGGYKKKLNLGVKLVYLLQPEWIDYLEYQKLVRADLAE